MNLATRGFLGFALKSAASLTFVCMALAPAATLAQSASRTKTEQWIHVRVESKEAKGETVRVNVPIEMAEKVLPAINKDKLHNGKVRMECAHMDDVDLKALLDAVRTSRDGEYVTVQSKENDVRVAKSNGYLYIHVTDRLWSKKAHAQQEGANTDSSRAAGNEEKVEVKIPMKVVDALFSAGKDELDVVAALRALSGTGDTELVSVKDSENTVRVWIDSKNVVD